MVDMLLDMAKKKPKPEKPGKAEKPKPAKEVLYVEVEASLKRRLVRLAELPHRNRKITAEAVIALRRYLEEEEAREGLGPIGQGEDD